MSSQRGCERPQEECRRGGLARFALEKSELRLPEVQLAAAALGSLRGTKTDVAEKTLLRLL
jgi:hypothetical protein